jgi:hypothetical protein
VPKVGFSGITAVDAVQVSRDIDQFGAMFQKIAVDNFTLRLRAGWQILGSHQNEPKRVAMELSSLLSLKCCIFSSAEA